MMLMRLRMLGRDERGASLVEFALFAPILGLMTMGITDLSRGISERLKLTQAVNRVIEIAASRPLPADQDADEVDYDFLKDEAAAAADVPVDQVTLTKWLECDGVEQDDFAGSCGSTDPIARYIQIRIDTLYEPTFFAGPVATMAGANDDGALPIFAEAAVRIQ